MRETANNAFGSWPYILPALGIDAKFLRNEHGPCPICAGKDRFRFEDQGQGKWFCSHCVRKGDPGPDGFRLLQLAHGWTFQQAADEVDRILGTQRPPKAEVKPGKTDEQRIEEARAIWAACRPVTQGDPVWLYLNRRCGLTEIPGEIRLHPGLRHSIDGGSHPTMVARMIQGRALSGVHRTYLTPDGQKAAVNPVKKTLGKLGEIRLAASGPVLGIAEGIETALCAAQKFGIPVWAATCALKLEDWSPPETVKRVVVLGDNDDTFTGQEAVFVLARKLALKGVEVEIQIPPRVDSDWADVAEVA